MKQFDSQGSEMEAQRKAILKNLEEKQTNASKDGDEYDGKIKSVNKILDQLKAGRWWYCNGPKFLWDLKFGLGVCVCMFLTVALCSVLPHFPVSPHICEMSTSAKFYVSLQPS